MKISMRLVAGWLAAAAAAAALFPARAADGPLAHDIRPGPGVTKTRNLSDYFPPLAGTPGDTPVYLMEGSEKGATVFVAGGTHANEIAGIMAAVVLVENARVLKGRMIVAPHANNSASSWTDPRRPGPEWISIETAKGARRFKYGARLTRPEHQGEPDPPKYRHPASSEEIDGFEARNLDRAYPGRPDGNLTQRIAHAITRLLEDEKADAAFDLHEAGPDSRLAWMVVANPKNVDTAALAVVNLDAAGIPMKLEPSSETFRGLSHREWGDSTGAASFLFETPNPAMVDRPRTGDPVNDARFPLVRRVGVHLATLAAVIDAFNETAPAGRAFQAAGLPSLDAVLSRGLGAFLR